MFDYPNVEELKILMMFKVFNGVSIFVEVSSIHISSFPVFTVRNQRARRSYIINQRNLCLSFFFKLCRLKSHNNTLLYQKCSSYFLKPLHTNISHTAFLFNIIFLSMHLSITSDECHADFIYIGSVDLRETLWQANIQNKNLCLQLHSNSQPSDYKADALCNRPRFYLSMLYLYVYLK